MKPQRTDRYKLKASEQMAVASIKARIDSATAIVQAVQKEGAAYLQALLTEQGLDPSKNWDLQGDTLVLIVGDNVQRVG